MTSMSSNVQSGQWSFACAAFIPGMLFLVIVYPQGPLPPGSLPGSPETIRIYVLDHLTVTLTAAPDTWSSG
jgi:hypothetical protein